MKRISILSVLFSSIIICSISCKNERGGNGITDFFKPEVIDIGALNNLLNNDSLSSIEELLEVDSTYASENISKLYSNKQSIWFDKFGLSQQGQELMHQIEMSKAEGLDPEDYNFSVLDSTLGNIENFSASDLRKTEYTLSQCFLAFSQDLLMGKVTPLSVDKNWQNINDTAWSMDTMIQQMQSESVAQVLEGLRPNHPWYKKFRNTAQRLIALNKLKIDKSELPEQLSIGDSSVKVQALRSILSKVADTTLDKSKMVWDAVASNALRDYQSKYNLSTTGQFDSATVASLTEESSETVKQLGINMERMRWLTKDFKDEFIWVNIPQMEVNYFEQDSVTFNMRAVVGRLSRKTPTLDSKLSNIVFNPPWYVPPTILKQEVLPGIMRRGGSYLARRGLVARDRRGRKINPSRINAKNYRRYSISQNPGRNSALGSVKFNFPNKEAIFLHDTNHRGDFGRKYRAFSSGCIRVHHPKDFAQFILRDTTYDEEGINKVIKNRQTKSVKVKRDIGVHIVYLTNAVDSAGNVVKVKDVYKWDKKLAAKL